MCGGGEERGVHLRGGEGENDPLADRRVGVVEQSVRGTRKQGVLGIVKEASTHN